jgi:hypothetical protein
MQALQDLSLRINEVNPLLSPAPRRAGDDKSKSTTQFILPDFFTIFTFAFPESTI